MWGGGGDGQQQSTDLIHTIQQKSDIDTANAQLRSQAGVGHLEACSIPAQLAASTLCHAHAPLPQHRLLILHSQTKPTAMLLVRCAPTHRSRCHLQNKNSSVLLVHSGHL